MFYSVELGVGIVKSSLQVNCDCVETVLFCYIMSKGHKKKKNQSSRYLRLR